MSFFRKSKKDKAASKKDKMDTFDARDIPHDHRSELIASTASTHFVRHWQRATLARKGFACKTRPSGGRRSLTACHSDTAQQASATIMSTHMWLAEMRASVSTPSIGHAVLVFLWQHRADCDTFAPAPHHTHARHVLFLVMAADADDAYDEIQPGAAGASHYGGGGASVRTRAQR